jgi:hypothetical protein
VTPESHTCRLVWISKCTADDYTTTMIGYLFLWDSILETALRRTRQGKCSIQSPLLIVRVNKVYLQLRSTFCHQIWAHYYTFISSIWLWIPHTFIQIPAQCISGGILVARYFFLLGFGDLLLLRGLLASLKLKDLSLQNSKLPCTLNQKKSTATVLTTDLWPVPGHASTRPNFLLYYRHG